MSNQGDINNLIDQAIPATNALNQALKSMVEDLYRVYNDRFPSPVISKNLFGGGAADIQGNVTGFSIVIQPDNLYLTWNDVDGHVAYEVRYNVGTSITWETATFVLDTDSRQANISPYTIPLLYGTYTFLIKAIDAAGTYSNTAASYAVIIPQITSPTVTSNVVGNNVLLSWTTPVSVLAIKEYIVKRNGSEIGRITGTFDIVFESTGGTYNYTITPVDIVGNVGATSPTVTVVLSDPTDFQFQASLTSTLNGTKSKTVIDTDGTLFAIIDDSISYQTHFTSHTWTTWQDPINAGYPLYFEPGPNTTGTYTETFDFGALFNSIIVNLDWNTKNSNGTVSITATISVSTDNITYDSPVAGTSRYASSARYVKVVITFTPTDALSSVNFYNFKCALSVHRSTDAGSFSAVTSDTTGTPVTFNVAFKAIDGLALTAQTTSSYKAVYSNLTTSGFKGWVFDDTGARVNATVTWVARGIL